MEERTKLGLREWKWFERNRKEITQTHFNKRIGQLKVKIVKTF